MLLRNMQNDVRVELFASGTVGMDGITMVEKGIRGGIVQVRTSGG
jgi:hypothetical protein